MKIYVASSWRNEAQPAVVEQLRRAGHEVYDFRHPHLGPGARGQGFRWSEIDGSYKDWEPGEFAAALLDPVAFHGMASDLMGMKWADAVLLLLPCGKSAHLELGWAIGAGKLSIILLPNAKTEPELMYGLADCICLSLDEVIDVLGGGDETEDDG